MLSWIIFHHSLLLFTLSVFHTTYNPIPNNDLLPEIPGQWALRTSVTVHISEPTYQLSVGYITLIIYLSFMLGKFDLNAWTLVCCRSLLFLYYFIAYFYSLQNINMACSQTPTWYNNLTNTRALTMTQTVWGNSQDGGCSPYGRWGCRGAVPVNRNLKNTDFVDTILCITWLPLQLKSATEIGWWLVH